MANSVITESQIREAARRYIGQQDSRYQKKLQVSYSAVIEGVGRDDLAQAVSATATIDGTPGMPVTVPYGAKITSGTRFMAVNYGSHVSPDWSMNGALASVGVPHVSEFVEDTDITGADGTTTLNYGAEDLLVGDPRGGTPSMWFDVSSGQLHIRNLTDDVFLFDAVEGVANIVGDLIITDGIIRAQHALGPMTQMDQDGFMAMDADGYPYFRLGADRNTGVVYFHIGEPGRGIHYAYYDSDGDTVADAYQLRVDVDAIFGLITANQVSFTVPGSSNIIGIINASTENGGTLKIDAAKVSITGLLTAQSIATAWNANTGQIVLTGGTITGPTIQTDDTGPRIVIAGTDITGYTDNTTVAYKISPSGITARSGVRVDNVGVNDRAAQFLYRMKGVPILVSKDGSGWGHHLYNSAVGGTGGVYYSPTAGGLVMNEVALYTNSLTSLSFPPSNAFCIEVSFTISHILSANSYIAFAGSDSGAGTLWSIQTTPAGRLYVMYKTQAMGDVSFTSTNVIFTENTKNRLAIRLTPGWINDSHAFILNGTVIAGSWSYTGSPPSAYTVPVATQLFIGAAYDGRVRYPLNGIFHHLRGYATWFTNEELIEHMDTL